MKTKIFAISLFALFLIGIVSAVTFSVSPSSFNIDPATNSSSFTITNTNSTALLNVNLPSQLQITGEDGYVAVFNVNPSGTISNINASVPRTVTITPASSIDFSRFKLEESYSGSINVTEQGNSANLKSINFVLKNSFCEAGEVGNLRVDYEITNKGQYGEDDEWYPFEEIEVEVTVENTGNDDIDDVIVSWGVYNKRTGEFIIDDEEKKVNIKDDDEETVTFTFTIDPNDLDESDSQDDFVLYVKAFSDDVGEDNQCNFKSSSVKIPRDDHFVTIDSEFDLQSSAQCSETVPVGFRVWNIGDSTEDNVYVIVSNKELGLNKRLEAGDLDVYEDKKLSLDFTVPANASEKAYTIDFSVYDEDDDVFVNDNDDESITKKSFSVSGGCVAKQSVDISSSLESEAVAGKTLTVRSTLRNTGSSATTYQVLVTGYDSWSTLQNIEPRTVTLNGGESKDVTITLIPNKGTTGDREFTVQALYNGLITEQKITVPLQASSGLGLTGFSVSNLFGGNSFIWVIGALNVILIILIIVIAVRIARK